MPTLAKKLWQTREIMTLFCTFGSKSVFSKSAKKSDINLKELAETLAWPGFQKVAVKYWRTGLGEMYRSFSKTAFTKALQKLIPEINEEDLVEGGAGVRAQACDRQGGLVLLLHGRLGPACRRLAGCCE